MNNIREQILARLKAGRSINPFEAMLEYGTLSLPYHVHCLRKEGHDIRTRYIDMFNGKRYAEYRLVVKEA